MMYICCRLKVLMESVETLKAERVVIDSELRYLVN